MPCSVSFWCAALISPLLAGSFLINGYRLVLMWRYEKMKESLKFGKLTLDSTQIQALQLARKSFTERYLLVGWAVHMTFIAVLTVPLYFTDDYWSTGNYGCRVRNADTLQTYGTKLDHLDAVWFSTCCIYIPFILWLIYTIKLAGNNDGLGLFRDLLVQFITNAGGFLSFFCLRYIFPAQWTDDLSPFMYLHALQPPLYCCMFVLYPVCHTYASYLRLTASSKVSHDANESGLEELLLSKHGVDYLMRQCRSEFCPETLQCVLEIRKIRKNYTRDADKALRGLYDSFIEDGAPFQVNLSSSMCENVASRLHMISSIKKEEYVHFYDGVERELIVLLTNNSFYRFKQTSFYKSYMNGVALPAEHRRGATMTSNFTVTSRSGNDNDNRNHSVQLGVLAEPQLSVFVDKVQKATSHRLTYNDSIEHENRGIGWGVGTQSDSQTSFIASAKRSRVQRMTTYPTSNRIELPVLGGVHES